MDKKQRRDKTFRLYKKRLKKWMSSGRVYINRDGEYHFDLKLIDYLNERAQYKLKHTATLCSCYSCSGYYKYRRNDKKQEDVRLVEEYKEGIRLDEDVVLKTID